VVQAASAFSTSAIFAKSTGAIADALDVQLQFLGTDKSGRASIAIQRDGHAT
jgi:hypothetical protein